MNINWNSYKQHTNSDGADSTVKWEQPGQTVVGVVTDGDEWTDENGKQVPWVTLTRDDSTTVTIWVRQKHLQQQLAAVEPHLGDRVKIEYTGVQNLTGGRTMKLFNVQVKRAPTASTTTTPDPTPAPPAPTTDNDIF